MRLFEPALMTEEPGLEAFRALYHALFPQVYKYVYLRTAVSVGIQRLARRRALPCGVSPARAAWRFPD